MTHTLNSRDACLAADAQDELRHTRNEFQLPEGVLYFDGNSLGALPKAAIARSNDIVTEEWGNELIRSWNTNQWFERPKLIGEKVADLVGGGEGNTVVTDTTSANLFKVLAASLRIQNEDAADRRVIIAERDAFPTDLYIIHGLNDLIGNNYELKLIDAPEELEGVLTDHVAAVVLSHINYRTGYLWNLNEVSKLVQQRGAHIIWDLCHSIGAVEIDLSSAGADFAVGCTYKYLNSGPGAPAMLWVNPKHQDRFIQPLSGWWGHARPFDMSTTYEPAEGIGRYLSSTQPIISLSLVEIGVDITRKADMSKLREKSLALTDLFIELVESRLSHHPLTLITPKDHAIRGSHVSFKHPEGFAVMQALIAEGVIGDYREPEVLRFGVTPLYIGYADVWDAVETLRRVLDEELWRKPEFQIRGAVT